MPEANDSGFIVSDVEGTAALPPAPPDPSAPPMPPPNPAPAATVILPLVPPPSDHHALNTGHSTELGDTAKGAFEKINKNFESLFQMVTGTKPAAASPDTSLIQKVFELVAKLESRLKALALETVTHSEFSAVVAKVEALEAMLKDAASAPPVEAVETVAKAEFDALQKRFNTLAGKLEVALGLEPSSPPPA